MRARWVAKENEHARPELYASPPPLETLKVVLPDFATATCGGKVVVLVDVRRAYFHATARRRVFVELPPEDYQAGDEHTCGAVAIQLVRHARRCPKWRGRDCIDTPRSQVDERERLPVCAWEGCIKGEHIVATVHGDDITIGGERSVWNSSLK